MYYSMAGHQRTADTPADGGRADTPAGGGQADTGGGAMLRIGTHAYAMGEGGMRMEPQRGGRERCIISTRGFGARRLEIKNLKVWLSSEKIIIFPP
jgi:hypothetical protein